MTDSSSTLSQPPSSSPAEPKPAEVPSTEPASRGRVLVEGDVLELRRIADHMLSQVDAHRIELLRTQAASLLQYAVGARQRYPTALSLYYTTVRTVTVSPCEPTDTKVFAASAAYSAALSSGQLLATNPGTHLRGQGPTDAQAVMGAVASTAVDSLRRTFSTLTYPLGALLSLACAYAPIQSNMTAGLDGQTDDTWNARPVLCNHAAFDYAVCSGPEYAEYVKAGYINNARPAWTHAPVVFLPSRLINDETVLAAAAIFCSASMPRCDRRTADNAHTIHAARFCTDAAHVSLSDTPLVLVCAVDRAHVDNSVFAQNANITTVNANTGTTLDACLLLLQWLESNATAEEKIGALLLLGMLSPEMRQVHAYNFTTDTKVTRVQVVRPAWDCFRVRLSNVPFIVPAFDRRSLAYTSTAYYAGALLFSIYRDYLGVRFGVPFEAMRWQGPRLGEVCATQWALFSAGSNRIFGDYDIQVPEPVIQDGTGYGAWAVWTPLEWFDGTSVAFGNPSELLKAKYFTYDWNTFSFQYGTDAQHNGWSKDAIRSLAWLASQHWTGNAAAEWVTDVRRYTSAITSTACNNICVAGGTNGMFTANAAGITTPAVVPCTTFYDSEVATHAAMGTGYYITATRAEWENLRSPEAVTHAMGYRVDSKIIQEAPSSQAARSFLGIFGQ